MKSPKNLETKGQHYKRLGKFGERALLLVNEIDQIKMHRSVEYFYVTETLYAKYLDFLNEAKAKLPGHRTFFDTTIFNLENNISSYSFNDAIQAIDYIIDLLLFEEETNKDQTSTRLFKSSEDKMKEAEIAFEKKDWDGCMNNANTALELMLKEKLGIPTTIKKIKTGRIIDYLLKINKGPTPFLKEAKSKILGEDNPAKHIAYSPDKSACVYALKALEELKRELKSKEINLTEEETKDIFKNL